MYYYNFLLTMIYLLAAILCIVAIISLAAKRRFLNWKKTSFVKPIWRNKYPSFEELHALFDRGDIMVASVLIASTLQLSHPQLSKAIKAHSTYKSDMWRRTIRTLAFIYIMIRSDSNEREQVIAWLQNLHRSIPLFVFETNVLVFATFAYGLVKAHGFLGQVTSEQADAIVSGVLGMADKLDPKDRGRKSPKTMAEVEDYLRKELAFDTDELLRINKESLELASIRKESKKQICSMLLRRPLTSMKFLLFRVFVGRLSNNVLAQTSQGRNTTGKPFWWFVRKIHFFLSYFHYSMCPQALTFDGTLDLLVAGNPRMENVVTELYAEIFGNKGGRSLMPVPETALRRFADMEAHLPRMTIDERPMPSVSGFCEEAVELVKCSRHRGSLAQTVSQPRHLGIIMDGNRRYSRKQGLPSVLSGHQVGAHKLIQVMSWAFSSGVQNLTVWALSDDNLKRGPQELDPLFAMMAEYIREMMVGDAPFLIPDVRFRVVGDRSILPDYLNDMITKAEVATSQNTKFNLQMAIGYGGRSEIILATKSAVRNLMLRGELSLEEAMDQITEADISNETYSARLGLPRIDAILRTSGENRLSGFALWESHHAEFAIVDEDWPALRQSTFLRSLLDLSKRNRRFGA